MNYSLNLFKSSFELAQTHADKSAYLDLWSAPDTVAALHRDAGGRPLFLFHDGPPYANGAAHLGHFLNKSLKDALVKFRRLDGYFAPFVPGFDCHGLPVELEVEKLGNSKADPVAFVRACREYALGQVANQTAEFRTFGVAADWEQPYRTLDPEFEAGAAELFMRLPGVSKRLRPVHWCPDCGSSLAEAEVEYKSRQADSLVVLFPLEGLAGEKVDDPVFLEVWTTTPYTLPANKAVAFHSGTDYVLVTEDSNTGPRRLVRARQEGDVPDLQELKLEGRWAKSPYTGERVPVLPADFVTSAGKGLVHMAPSFGLDDFRVCEAHGLSVDRFVDDHGHFVQGEMAGMNLKEAAAHVLERVAPLVYRLDKLQHDYPHCWRHKRPLFFKASEEWFLDLSEVGERAVEALDAVQFVPEAGRDRLASMLSARTSWCLSRNRLWGTPLVDPDSPDDQALAARVETEGVEAWQSQGPRRTLDVWFDSGATHELVLKRRFGRTADVYLEGSDQHRGWFQSSLLTAVGAGGPAPFKTVLTHGFVVDEHGRKYSKSSGNYMPLGEMFERYSPDVLRLWALQQDFTKELKLSPASLAATVDRYRKLRNTLRFCLQNLGDFDHQPVPLVLSLHRLQVLDMQELVATVRDAGARYDFAAATAALLQYAETVSSDYFTVVKDALYCDAVNSPRRRQAQYVLSLVLDTMVRLLVPVLPYTSEEVFQLVREPMGLHEATSLLLTLEGSRLPAVLDAAPLRAWLAPMAALKREVNHFVEANRSKDLKGRAQLDLVLTVPADVMGSRQHEELRDYFGCAGLAVVQGVDYGVAASLTTLGLCPRCRQHHETVEGGLCERCDSVEGAAESSRANAAADALA